ncbi:MAG: hypothetical protein COY80_03620 [Candidatus Pacebacteria bacterium CG_4_10_14_0_8_um_filter_42_14]|nr:MAG: hypothetical protein COY80_03620 [Candidatus Pacebacteria bacterium CG_4_10_14_0_8_um_filter_42_14]
MSQSRVVFFLSALAMSATPAMAQTQEWTPVCVYGGVDGVATLQGLECLIANAFTVIISIIGLAAFVMFIVASFKWMLAGSNSKNVEDARKTITYAVVGIVVSLSAFIILNLISNFTGITSVTEFKIPRSEPTPTPVAPTAP